jgi:hypothetical protein
LPLSRDRLPPPLAQFDPTAFGPVDALGYHRAGYPIFGQ